MQFYFWWLMTIQQIELSKQDIDIFKSISMLNPYLVIYSGKRLASITEANNIVLDYTSDNTFPNFALHDTAKFSFK